MDFEQLRAEARELIAAGQVEEALAVLDRAGGDGGKMPLKSRHARKLNAAMRGLRTAHRHLRAIRDELAKGNPEGDGQSDDAPTRAARLVGLLRELGVVGEKGEAVLLERAKKAKDPISPDGSVKDGDEDTDPNDEADANDPGKKGPHGRGTSNQGDDEESLEDKNKDDEEAWTGNPGDEDPDKVGRKRGQAQGTVLDGEETGAPMDAHDPGKKGPHGRLLAVLIELGLDADEIARVLEAVTERKARRVEKDVKKQDVGQGGPDADDDDEDDANKGTGPKVDAEKAKGAKSARSTTDGSVVEGEEDDQPGNEAHDQPGKGPHDDSPGKKKNDNVERGISDTLARSIDEALASGGEIEIVDATVE